MFTNQKSRAIIVLLSGLVFVGIVSFIVYQNLKPVTLNAQYLNEIFDTAEYQEVYHVGKFESGKGIICVAKSMIPEVLYEEFKGSFPDGPLNSAENLHVIYFVKQGNRFSYRSRQDIDIKSLSETPTEPIEIVSSASYGKKNLYYIAYIGNERKKIEIEGKQLYFNSFVVDISGKIQTVNLAYYISENEG